MTPVPEHTPADAAAACETALLQESPVILSVNADGTLSSLGQPRPQVAAPALKTFVRAGRSAASRAARSGFDGTAQCGSLM